ncbi:MAG: diguanylate cyclase [Deltaproteobacteria bacterium]|nr:diguanylate cyclase [Deltaproteobacteria bacterium]
MKDLKLSLLLIEECEKDCDRVRQNILKNLPEASLLIKKNITESLRLLEKGGVDLILTNHRPPSIDSFALLLRLHERRLRTPVVLIVSDGNEKIAAEAIKQGAYDYLTQEEIQTVSLGHIVLTVLERKRLRDEIEVTAQKLKDLAIRDGLTDLYNHRYFYEMVTNEFERCRRYHHPLSLLMLDIDYFKSVNDTYGHRAGDYVLTHIAGLLRQSFRSVDWVARYGGDEFAVILPETPLSQAMMLAHRIRKKIEAHPFSPPPGEVVFYLTVSIGVSSLSEGAMTKDDLIAFADKGLYEAKSRGRGTVCTHKDARSEMPVTINARALSELVGKIHEITEEVKKGYLEAIFQCLQHLSLSQQLLNQHSLKVSFLASQLAERLSLAEAEIGKIRSAGLLHDIGKVAIDEKILVKKEKLSSQEYQLLQKHPTLGAQILQQIRFVETEVPMVLHHHERYDGYGYPSRLKGSEIPTGARILAIAEAWDSMTNDQPYRSCLTVEQALEEIRRGAGTQFDPDFTHVFVEMVQGG